VTLTHSLTQSIDDTHFSYSNDDDDDGGYEERRCEANG